ncbi:MAG: UDP-glucose 4-epimerase GalE [Clostridiaceae bacterium]
MAVLICGGAGYIGSHFVRRLADEGEDIIVVDNLVTGHRKAVDKRAAFYEGNIADRALMRDIFSKHQIESVVHFAAFTQVGESMVKPLEYFENNFCATRNLLEVMAENEVKHMVFSSTAAVYGNPGVEFITEKTPVNPMNPYGESKLSMERMIHWTANNTGMTYMSMRYFNVAGAQPDGSIGEDHRPESHIVPIAINSALNNKEFTIFGDDYPTEDGTCVRDYVHVVDLADAHYLALCALRQGHSSDIFNLGSGSGYSNGEIVKNVKEVTSSDFPVKTGPRRAGDPPRLVAVSEKIRQDLKWTPKHENIRTIIETATNWHKNKPKGYED